MDESDSIYYVSPQLIYKFWIESKTSLLLLWNRKKCPALKRWNYNVVWEWMHVPIRWMYPVVIIQVNTSQHCVYKEIRLFANQSDILPWLNYLAQLLHIAFCSYLFKFLPLLAFIPPKNLRTFPCSRNVHLGCWHRWKNCLLYRLTLSSLGCSWFSVPEVHCSVVPWLNGNWGSAKQVTLLGLQEWIPKVVTLGLCFSATRGKPSGNRFLAWTTRRLMQHTVTHFRLATRYRHQGQEPPRLDQLEMNWCGQIYAKYVILSNNNMETKEMSNVSLLSRADINILLAFC